MATSNKLKSNETALIDTITSWWSREMEDRARFDGWIVYLVTFSFNHIPSRPATQLKAMQDSVCRFHSNLVRRVVRRPNSIYQMHKRPRMIAAPDYPVFKHEKSSQTKAGANNGLHMHGILGLPSKSRLKDELAYHVRRKHHAYIRAPLKDIHFEPVENDMEFVVDYALKSIKRGRCSWEDLVFLPKSLAESPG